MVDMLVVVLHCLYVDTWAVGNVCTPLETFTAGLKRGLAPDRAPITSQSVPGC